MAHIHRHTDTGGDIIDISYFCSDDCHQTYCTTTGREYPGWDGCHEIYAKATCESCGAKLDYVPQGGYPDEFDED